MTDAQPFMDEALALWATLPKESAGIHAIATALSSAYQRGREDERAEQDRRTEEYPKRWAERHSAIRTQRDKGGAWQRRGKSGSDS